MDRPAAEVVVDDDLVAGLLREQHPDLADRPIRVFERGWDNTNYRLGNDLIVRIPHRAAAAEIILNEQRWLAQLAPRLPLPIPVPVRIGRPGCGYPWHWSINPWFDGAVAAVSSLADPEHEAGRLGEFLARLHVPGPTGAPVNPFRGGPLADRSAAFERNLSELTLEVDAEKLGEIFSAGTTAGDPRHVWLHGDLHSRNVLVNEGRLAAVIDWGDLGVGDPACDLASAFMLVPGHVDTVVRGAGASDQEWVRARGWAAHFAVMYVNFGDDDAVMRQIGTELLAYLDCV